MTFAKVIAFLSYVLHLQRIPFEHRAIHVLYEYRHIYGNSSLPLITFEAFFVFLCKLKDVFPNMEVLQLISSLFKAFP